MRPRIIPSAVAGFVVPGGGYLVSGHERRGAVVLAVVLILASAGAFAAAAGRATAFYACIAFGLFVYLGALVGAVLARPGVLRPPLATLGLVVGALVVSYGVQLILRTQVVEMFRAPSGSMIPTIGVGEHFAVDKRARSPKRGDVVVFHAKSPEGNDVSYVKRVIAVGGDRIAFRDDVPILDGKPLPQTLKGDGNEPGSRVLAETLEGHTYDILRTLPVARDTDEIVLLPDELYLVGDNRDNSNDSRFTGPVDRRDVVGTARFVWLGLTADRTGAEIR